MTHISIILLSWMSSFQVSQDLYVCKNAKIGLYSSAPIEDIKAETNTGRSVFTATGDLNFSVNISSFKFDKTLMQEHFNENYMESDKYPQAMFRGKINEHIDVTKDGNYPVTVTGELTVHGVKKVRTITGNIMVKGDIISMTSEFMVKCADHHIDIPQLVFHNIAESIKINVAATYTLFKKTN